MTKFRPCSPIATGNHLDRTKKIQICSNDWHRWRFWSAFRHFGTHFAESFRMSKSSWMMVPSRSRDMPSCWAIDLAEIRRSTNIRSWIWSKISGVFIVLFRPGRGASQVEKSPRLNWTTQFLTVEYDGACSPNVTFRMAWISFSALPCRKKKSDDSWFLHVIEIARVAWHASFQPLWQGKICNSAHEETLLSDTLDSVLRYWEVGRAKDLSAPLVFPNKSACQFVVCLVLKTWVSLRIRSVLISVCE